MRNHRLANQQLFQFRFRREKKFFDSQEFGARSFRRWFYWHGKTLALKLPGLSISTYLWRE